MGPEAQSRDLRLVVQDWLHTHWYRSDSPPWYLRALEGAYRAAWRYQHRPRRTDQTATAAAVPQIVVGNITVGGSGKTPLVAELCRLAGSLGFTPGIASTGYGRKSSATLLVSADSDPRLCGDEPLLLAQCTAAPVVVARRRADALAKLAQTGVNLIISDDGLQQPGIGWDLTLCMIDGERGTGNGHLLPAGPLREEPHRLFDVDYVICKGNWSGAPQGLETHTIQLLSGQPHSLDDDRAVTMMQLLRQAAEKHVHAFAGIGNPRPFFAMLEQQGFAVTRHRFADHHAYRREDFDSMSAHATIIMTAKDAVKCRGLGLSNAWYVPVEARLPKALETRLTSSLEQLRHNRASDKALHRAVDRA